MVSVTVTKKFVAVRPTLVRSRSSYPETALAGHLSARMVAFSTVQEGCVNANQDILDCVVNEVR